MLSLCHFVFTRVIMYNSVVHAFQVNLSNTTSALSLINASSLPMSLNNVESHIKKKHLSIHHYCPLCDMMRLECFGHIFHDYQNVIDHFTKKYKSMQDRVKILWVVKSFFFLNSEIFMPWILDTLSSFCSKLCRPLCFVFPFFEDDLSVLREAATAALVQMPGPRLHWVHSARCSRQVSENFEAAKLDWVSFCPFWSQNLTAWGCCAHPEMWSLAVIWWTGFEKGFWAVVVLDHLGVHCPPCLIFSEDISISNHNHFEQYIDIKHSGAVWPKIWKRQW